MFSRVLYSFFFFCLLFQFVCSGISRNVFFSGDRYQEIREYENNIGSRIEQYLEVARDELLENFKKKEYLMIREEQPPPVLHPRKDVYLREIIFTAHQEQAITDQQHLDYLAQCDKLYELWEEHWRIARKKANRMGFDR